MPFRKRSRRSDVLRAANKVAQRSDDGPGGTNVDTRNIFQAERLLRQRCQKGKTFYLVKWKGFNHSHNTWEPENNILDQRLIQNFKAKRQFRSGDDSKTRSQPEVGISNTVVRTSTAQSTTAKLHSAENSRLSNKQLHKASSNRNVALSVHGKVPNASTAKTATNHDKQKKPVSKFTHSSWSGATVADSLRDDQTIASPNNAIVDSNNPSSMQQAEPIAKEEQLEYSQLPKLIPMVSDSEIWRISAWKNRLPGNGLIKSSGNTKSGRKVKSPNHQSRLNRKQGAASLSRETVKWKSDILITAVKANDLSIVIKEAFSPIGFFSQA